MDALSEVGIKQLNTPLTPSKIWQAIRDAKAAAILSFSETAANSYPARHSPCAMRIWGIAQRRAQNPSGRMFCGEMDSGLSAVAPRNDGGLTTPTPSSR